MKILGYRSEYDLEHNTCPGEYPGNIIPMTEKDLPPKYSQFVFAVNAFCPRGVSGSPVILDGSNNNNNSIILLGSCAGYIFENKMGIISYSNLIVEIIEVGVNLHIIYYHSLALAEFNCVESLNARLEIRN